MQHGQTKVQAEQLDSNIPMNNLPDQDGPKQQKPRTRGQPQANVAVPAHSLVNDEDISLPAKTRTCKCGWKAEMTMKGPSDDPAPKRAKGDMDEASQLSAKGKAQHGQKQTGVVNARDPLPDHPGRDVHPTKPTTTHRTSQEVAAECKAKKQAMEEKIHQGEKAKEFLALMNINEDLNDEELLTKNPQRLSAAIHKCGRACLDDSDDEGEEFNFDAVEDGIYSDDLMVEPAKAKGKTVSGQMHASVVD
ncbi:hypothetical protein L208DRAFT_1304320 [Tricholoma matsutake]|nr:hypothetical protein L208DRAFT_1304320 [Tricholoma matsutake 945]